MINKWGSSIKFLTPKNTIWYDSSSEVLKFLQTIDPKFENKRFQNVLFIAVSDHPFLHQTKGPFGPDSPLLAAHATRSPPYRHVPPWGSLTFSFPAFDGFLPIIRCDTYLLNKFNFNLRTHFTLVIALESNFSTPIFWFVDWSLFGCPIQQSWRNPPHPALRSRSLASSRATRLPFTASLILKNNYYINAKNANAFFQKKTFPLALIAFDALLPRFNHFWFYLFIWMQKKCKWFFSEYLPLSSNPYILCVASLIKYILVFCIPPNRTRWQRCATHLRKLQIDISVTFSSKPKKFIFASQDFLQFSLQCSKNLNCATSKFELILESTQ